MNGSRSWNDTRAWLFGSQAGRNGHPQSENPFIASDARRAWREGWESGRKRLDVEVTKLAAINRNAEFAG